jgi:hypothetical protein
MKIEFSLDSRIIYFDEMKSDLMATAREREKNTKITNFLHPLCLQKIDKSHANYSYIHMYLRGDKSEREEK